VPGSELCSRARCTPPSPLDLSNAARTEAESNTRAVIDLLQGLARAQTANEAAVAALTSVRSAFGWVYGSFWTIDAATDTMRLGAESGTINPAFQQATAAASFREGQGLVGGACRSERCCSWRTSAP
jgi:hypothetical protein